MLSLYQPGTGLLHRMPAGPKALALAVVVLALSFLPSAWWAAGVALAVAPLGYAVAGLGAGILVRQVGALRWLLAVTLGVQLLFVAPEAAVANTNRVLATILLASLLVLTTCITDLLDAVERLLTPTARWGLDPQRASLLLSITITTVPVLARLGSGVREAQRARGAPASLARFVVPFLVVSLKHADELGEALTARGVR
ncbi:energy-coupling factor transporter transmembrane protein EcfT [Arthrobacter sp. JSM 101049]|uniref:energy-coupling factor transporter transmembrane component T family protein n=1 Tax=Arthrobacter sp. JSM 101049 TaxID=929097 RepID=UPI003568B021